jgi:hypothetical protein
MNTPLKALDERGWVILERAVDADLVRRLNEDVGRAYKTCRDMQVRNAIDVGTDGSAHHALILGASFLEFLDACVPMDIISTHFGGRFIVNSFGSTTNVKGRRIYSRDVHRDVRFYSCDLPIMLNMLVTLHDFTLDNGATYLLSGSHRVEEKPSDEAFFQRAERAVCSAGSIVLFNSNVWHAAGDNTTDEPRQALTITLTRPFVKQQFDYCRAFGYEAVATMSEQLQQLLGYYSRVACTLDEWYQPPARRMFRPGQ